MDTPEQDPVWNAAWHWVMAEHEDALTAGQRGEMLDWLQAHPAHRTAYQEASRLWLLGGLVPPAETGDTP